MRFLCWSLTVFLPFPCLLHADVGTSGWTIFTKAQTAKYAGIASVAPGYADISAVLFNPALPATMMVRELSIMSEQGFADDVCGGFIYGMLAGQGVVSGGFSYYDLGSTELNWIDNGQLITESVRAQRDMMGFVSYARRVSRSVCMGLSLKGASSEIAQRKSAIAVACDAGATFNAGERWSFSAAVRNVGSSTAFVSQKAPLPASMMCAANITGKLARWYYVASAGGNFIVNDDSLYPESGVELGTDNFVIDASYRFNNEEFPVNVGFGVVVGPIFFQYIFAPGMNVGSVHRLGITYRYGH